MGINKKEKEKNLFLICLFCLLKFQIPDRQYGSHHRREQEQHSVRIRSGEHHMSGLHAGHSRGRRGKVHHLQRVEGGVRHVPHHQSQPADHCRLRQALQAHVLYHHLPFVHASARRA